MIEKLKPLGKKLSPLGKLLPLTDLIGINKDNAGEKIGSVGGRFLNRRVSLRLEEFPLISFLDSSLYALHLNLKQRHFDYFRLNSEALSADINSSSIVHGLVRLILTENLLLTEALRFYQ